MFSHRQEDIPHCVGGVSFFFLALFVGKGGEADGEIIMFALFFPPFLVLLFGEAEEGRKKKYIMNDWLLCGMGRGHGLPAKRVF